MRTWLAGLLWLSMMSATSLAAENQYRGIAFPPNEFYEALVGYAQGADYASLSRSLSYLDPLFTALEKRFHENFRTNLQTAIEQRNPQRVLSAVFRCLIMDMQFNLEAAGSESAEAPRKERILMAYTDYTFLSPILAKTDPIRAAALGKALKKLYRTHEQDVAQSTILWLGNQISEISSRGDKP
jgi:hypothetical protein